MRDIEFQLMSGARQTRWIVDFFQFSESAEAARGQFEETMCRR